MTRSLTATAAAAVMIVSASAAVAQTSDMGWIGDLLDNRCTPEMQTMVSDATRETIENSVSRAEAALPPPTPIGDLGCLDGIMEGTNNFFSESGLNADVVKAVFDELNVGDQVCDFAKSKWEEVSGPLTGDLSNLQIPDFGSNFDLSNLPRTLEGLMNTGGGSGGSTGGSVSGGGGGGSSIWDMIGSPSQP